MELIHLLSTLYEDFIALTVLICVLTGLVNGGTLIFRGARS